MADTPTPSPKREIWRVELACPCCQGNASDADVEATLDWLQEIDRAVGGRRIHIVSGYRCERWNQIVGGDRDSEHLKGTAVNVVVRQWSPATLQKAIRDLYPDVVSGFGSLTGYTHLDRRKGPPATWRK